MRCHCLLLFLMLEACGASATAVPTAPQSAVLPERFDVVRTSAEAEHLCYLAAQANWHGKTGQCQELAESGYYPCFSWEHGSAYCADGSVAGTDCAFLFQPLHQVGATLKNAPFNGGRLCAEAGSYDHPVAALPVTERPGLAALWLMSLKHRTWFWPAVIASLLTTAILVMTGLRLSTRRVYRRFRPELPAEPAPANVHPLSQAS